LIGQISSLVGSPLITTSDDVLKAVEKKIQHCKNNQLKYERKGKVIIIRDLFDKIATWVRKFEKIGDTAV
jgi:hypothetical protein